MGPIDSQTLARFSFLIPFWALSNGFLRARETTRAVGSDAQINEMPTTANVVFKTRRIWRF